MNVAHNANEKRISTHSQPGGVASLAIDRLATKVDTSGCDPSGLGRWIWTRFVGKNGRMLRVFTAYRPCISKGSNSCYVQQVRHFVQNTENCDPREALMSDLRADILKGSEAGDSIIGMGDFNVDVRGEDFTIWKEDLELQDVMVEAVGPENAPRTYARGSNPIDTILASANVNIAKAAYLPFGEGVGDHRSLLIDVEESSVFGTSGEPSAKLRARRLKMKDPRIVTKYINLLHKLYLNHKLFKKVFYLNSIPISYPINPQAAELFEEVDRIRTQGMLHAEKRCRKLYGGKVPWSPEVTEAHLQVELWTLVLRRLKGCHISARTILRKRIKPRWQQI